MGSEHTEEPERDKEFPYISTSERNSLLRICTDPTQLRRHEDEIKHRGVAKYVKHIEKYRRRCLTVYPQAAACDPGPLQSQAPTKGPHFYPFTGPTTGFFFLNDLQDKGRLKARPNASKVRPKGGAVPTQTVLYTKSFHTSGRFS